MCAAAEPVISDEEYLRKILLAPVYEAAVQTPLSALTALSERYGRSIWLKREDRQPVHSFKVRGAVAKIAALSEEQQRAGVVAASAGNHAQGVALAAKQRGLRATIVMPLATPDIKVSAVKRLGAEVVLHGANFDAALAKSYELAKEHGYTMVLPFDDPDTIAGQGTIGKELVDQARDMKTVFVPVGGGGLAAGVALYIKQLLPSVRVIGVQAEGSASLKAALAAGQPQTLLSVSRMADGVAVRRTGTETFRLCKKHLDDVITVTNDEICGAVKAIFDDTRAIAEPSGAVALAGLVKCVRNGSELTPAGAKLVAVLSGANVNFHTLRYVSERCAVGEHAEGMLAVTIPERPGSFLQLCDVLGPGRIVTEFNYRYSKAGDADIFLGVALSSRGAGADELRGVIASLKDAGYGVADMTENELAKSHVRYMVGGRPPPGSLRERLLAFGFPERAGALRDFVAALGSLFNITLFHYRTTSEDVGRVLCAFEVPDPTKDATLLEHCDRLGFPYTDVSDDPAYSIFLK